ncbi:hypothetical protein [Crucivirus-432]|nr:hypothetical protein [Crucivirus-432]
MKRTAGKFPYYVSREGRGLRPWRTFCRDLLLLRNRNVFRLLFFLLLQAQRIRDHLIIQRQRHSMGTQGRSAARHFHHRLNRAHHLFLVSRYKPLCRYNIGV